MAYFFQADSCTQVLQGCWHLSSLSFSAQKHYFRKEKQDHNGGSSNICSSMCFSRFASNFLVHPSQAGRVFSTHLYKQNKYHMVPLGDNFIGLAGTHLKLFLVLITMPLKRFLLKEIVLIAQAWNNL